MFSSFQSHRGQRISVPRYCSQQGRSVEALRAFQELHRQAPFPGAQDRPPQPARRHPVIRIDAQVRRRHHWRTGAVGRMEVSTDAFEVSVGDFLLYRLISIFWERPW